MSNIEKNSPPKMSEAGPSHLVVPLDPKHSGEKGGQIKGAENEEKCPSHTFVHREVERNEERCQEKYHHFREDRRPKRDEQIFLQDWWNQETS